MKYSRQMSNRLKNMCFIPTDLLSKEKTLNLSIRPSNTDPYVYSKKLSSDVRELVKKGVKPENITIVGFSRGAFITGLVSQELSDLEVVQGSREKAVRDNASILIGESVATKYFGRGPAVGKRLTLDGNIDYEVVGVFKDTPVNSHFKPEFIARFDENRYRDRPDMLESWKHIFFHS